MPPRGLPGNANIEQLRNGAKSFQRAVHAGDAGAAEVVREFHPRLAQSATGLASSSTHSSARMPNWSSRDRSVSRAGRS